jgi:DNA-binding transcriptional LysR family regulator
VHVAVPAGHPAVAGGRLRFADLAETPWATGEAGGGMAELVRRVCNGAGGFEPRIRHHTNELLMLLQLVSQDEAVTLLPAIALIGAPDGIVTGRVTTKGADLGRTVFTATRAGSDRRPALAAVREALREAAAVRPALPTT